MSRLHVLASGTPTPTAERFGSSFVLETGDDYLMFDCGPAATHKLVRAGLWPTDINHLFFTHHHFDHNVDYPCFLLCRWDQGAGHDRELQVFGPTETSTITDRLIGPEGAFFFDWNARVNHPGSQQVFQNRGGVLPRRPPSVDVNDIGPGRIHSGESWEVTAAPALHAQPYLDSLAYRVDADDTSIVFTGDTAPCDTVTDLARGADVLVCMCWDDQEVMAEMGENRSMTGTVGAGELAEETGVSTLVLVHTGPRLSTHGHMEKGMGDIRQVFGGKVVFSEELMTLDL